MQLRNQKSNHSVKLFALGIRYVGETVSKKITSKIFSIDDLMKLRFTKN